MARAVEPRFAARDYTPALQQLSALRQAVDDFFDSVMVMADDAALRANRLALLNRMQGLFMHAADLSRLPGLSGGSVVTHATDPHRVAFHRPAVPADGIFGVVVLVGACCRCRSSNVMPSRGPGAACSPGSPASVCGLRYTIEGQENLPDRPFISLWKHSSSWETMAQMFVVPPASWLLKREVIWIPIVGWAVRTYKPIAINRSAGHSAVNQVVAQGRERLAAGMGVIVYPEGTRVAPGQKRKYGVSGALLACETGAPVVPIAHNFGYFWRRRSLLKKPGTIRVVIGPRDRSRRTDAA